MKDQIVLLSTVAVFLMVALNYALYVIRDMDRQLDAHRAERELSKVRAKPRAPTVKAPLRGYVESIHRSAWGRALSSSNDRTISWAEIDRALSDQTDRDRTLTSIARSSCDDETMVG